MAGTHGTLNTFIGVSRLCGIGGGPPPSVQSAVQHDGVPAARASTSQCWTASWASRERLSQLGHERDAGPPLGPSGPRCAGRGGRCAWRTTTNLYDLQNQFIDSREHMQSFDYCFQPREAGQRRPCHRQAARRYFQALHREGASGRWSVQLASHRPRSRPRGTTPPGSCPPGPRWPGGSTSPGTSSPRRCRLPLPRWCPVALTCTTGPLPAR